MGTPRNRIVIALDDKVVRSPKRTRGRSRLVRVLLVLLVVGLAMGVVSLAGGLLWWQYFKTTPSYSIALLTSAAQKGDVGTIDQVVNSDKIAANLTSELTQKAAARYGTALEVSARQQVESLAPALLPEVKETIRKQVTEVVQGATKQIAEKPFIITALSVPYALKITTENDVAKVVIPNVAMELTLSKNGSRWQVINIKDELLIQRLVDQMIEQLPAISTQPLGQLPLGRPPRPRGRRGR